MGLKHLNIVLSVDSINNGNATTRGLQGETLPPNSSLDRASYTILILPEYNYRKDGFEAAAMKATELPFWIKNTRGH